MGTTKSKAKKTAKNGAIFKRNTKKIVKETAKFMENLGTYKPEFVATILAYGEKRAQLDFLSEKFYAEDAPITEEYTNKAGATNIRKTALYMALETLRKEVLEHENILGLTPAGLKKINDGMRFKRKASKLDKALADMQNGA